MAVLMMALPLSSRQILRRRHISRFRVWPKHNLPPIERSWRVSYVSEPLVLGGRRYALISTGLDDLRSELVT